MRYITIITYTAEQAIIDQHNDIFKHKNPQYAFLFERINNKEKYLYIDLNLSSPKEATFLSLQLGYTFVRKNKPIQEILDSFGNFDTLAYFQIENPKPRLVFLDKNPTQES
jgi:hypothetical protein